MRGKGTVSLSDGGKWVLMKVPLGLSMSPVAKYCDDTGTSVGGYTYSCRVVGYFFVGGRGVALVGWGM